MRNKAHDEAIRFQEIAKQRQFIIDDLINDQKIMKLEHAVELLQAANKITRLERRIEELQCSLGC